MENFSILRHNQDFFMQAYNINGVVGVLMIVAIIDVLFKGWAMWRAARLQKKSWFIALLLINSMAILPIIFLLMTNADYENIKAK